MRASAISGSDLYPPNASALIDRQVRLRSMILPWTLQEITIRTLVIALPVMNAVYAKFAVRQMAVPVEPA